MTISLQVAINYTSRQLATTLLLQHIWHMFYAMHTSRAARAVATTYKFHYHMQYLLKYIENILSEVWKPQTH